MCWIYCKLLFLCKPGVFTPGCSEPSSKCSDLFEKPWHDQITKVVSRNIAKTPFFSKVYESCLADWLLPIIQPFLDPGQCGLKGLFITHYLIKLLDFTNSILDKRQPHAVLAAWIDLSKAFNRVRSPNQKFFQVVAPRVHFLADWYSWSSIMGLF